VAPDAGAVPAPGAAAGAVSWGFIAGNSRTSLISEYRIVRMITPFVSI
jgi:hypothetical protein